MSPRSRPSGRLAGDVVAYLVAGVDEDVEADNRPAHNVVGSRELDRIRGSLSELDLAVLQTISDLNYVTSRHVQRLFFDGATGRRDGASRRGSGRLLTRLQRLGIVDHLDRRVGGVWAGSAPHIWRLAPAGRRLVGDGSATPVREPGLRHLAHELAVAELVVRVHETARHHGLEVVTVETGPSCWQPFSNQGKTGGILKPDFRLTIAQGQAELHWFVEVDRASEHMPTVRRKVDAYVRLWREGRGRSSGVFPRVLWAVPHERRASQVRQVCTESEAPSRMFDVAVMAEAAVRLLGAP